MSDKNITEETEARFRALGKKAYLEGAAPTVHLNPTFAAVLSEKAIREIETAFQEGFYEASRQRKMRGA